MGIKWEVGKLVPYDKWVKGWPQLAEWMSARISVDAPPHIKKPVDWRVLEAMIKVPRHEHIWIAEVPWSQRDEIYNHEKVFYIEFSGIEDPATASQPMLVAIMLHELIDGKKSGGRMAEIGAGLGYALRVAAETNAFERIVGIERKPELARLAKEKLQAFNQVEIVTGDGVEWVKNNGPFDSILVSAGAYELEKVEVLKNALNDGGRLVVPESGVDKILELWSYQRQGNELHGHYIFDVDFVKLR
jgi:protein-L-isoaspartate(D-aspartate) O-methyltransferase